MATLLNKDGNYIVNGNADIQLINDKDACFDIGCVQNVVISAGWGDVREVVCDPKQGALKTVRTKPQGSVSFEMREFVLRNLRWALGFGANIVDWTTGTTRQIGADDTAPTAAGEAEYWIVPWTEGTPDTTVYTLNKNVKTGADFYWADDNTFGSFDDTAITITESDLCLGKFEVTEDTATPLVYTFTYDEGTDYETLWSDDVNVDPSVAHGDTVAMVAAVYEWGVLAAGGQILRSPWDEPDTAQINITFDNDATDERYTFRIWKVEFGGAFNVGFPGDSSDITIPFTGTMLSKTEAHPLSPLFEIDRYPIV